MKLAAAILLASTLAACGPSAPPDEQALRRATALVWFGSYGARWDWEPPAIQIVEQKCMTGAATEFEHYDCADGYYHAETNTITVGWWTRTIHESSLAHELYHSYQQRMHRDADGGHVGLGWRFAVPDAEHDLADEGQ